MRKTEREESQMPTSKKSFDPETFVRDAYAAAERMDLKGWKSLFAHDGIFTDQSVGVTYQGPDLDYPVRQYGTAFGDMHRELYDFWTVGDTVIVRLALQGTHTGPLATPFGTLPPRETGWMPRVRTSSNWPTAKSRGSTAIWKVR
jgi:hypothetical protein